MVIYVKSFKIFLKTFVISGWCLAVFIGVGYYYIQSQIAPAESEAESVPYYDYTPENKGVLWSFGSRTVYTYLDFSASNVTVMINPESLEQSGYNADFLIAADYSLISCVVDYFEGVNLNFYGETLRYTGGQIVDLLSHDGSIELRKSIISAIFSKISEQGVGLDFFNKIITSSKTDLKIPDCYFWKDEMMSIAKNVNYLRF